MSRVFGPKGHRDRLLAVFELPDHLIEGCADAEANRTASLGDRACNRTRTRLATRAG